MVAVLTEGVVLAADGLSIAASASSTDDGDGITLKANGNIQVLKNNAHESEEASQSAIFCLSSDGLATLNRTGVALADRGRRRGLGDRHRLSDSGSCSGRTPGCGDSKDGEEGNGREDGELREHDV